MTDLTRLYQKLGYEFNDDALLKNALTHRSKAQDNNERLEFLGDAILSFVISEVLYQNFPDAREGDLSRLRAHFVNGESLAEIARELELGDHLLLGQGEMRSGGFRRDSILADAFEAVIAAVFLDSDIEHCRRILHKIYHERLQDQSVFNKLKDPKTRLQEHLQALKLPLPEYQLIASTGEQHNQQFTVRCRVESLALEAKGKAETRRKAEKIAARKMYKLLNKAKN